MSPCGHLDMASVSLPIARVSHLIARPRLGGRRSRAEPENGRRDGGGIVDGGVVWTLPRRELGATCITSPYTATFPIILSISQILMHHADHTAQTICHYCYCPSKVTTTTTIRAARCSSSRLRSFGPSYSRINGFWHNVRHASDNYATYLYELQSDHFGFIAFNPRQGDGQHGMGNSSSVHMVSSV